VFILRLFIKVVGGLNAKAGRLNSYFAVEIFYESTTLYASWPVCKLKYNSTELNDVCG
jgi:hypothetical protein